MECILIKMVQGNEFLKPIANQMTSVAGQEAWRERGATAGPKGGEAAVHTAGKENECKVRTQIQLQSCGRGEFDGA